MNHNMKTLKDYLIRESKTVDKALAKKVADEIMRLADASSCSFWSDLGEDEYTGDFEGMSYDEFLEALPNYIAGCLEGESIPVDPDSFTNDIQDAFCGDPYGEYDMGYNAHDEILEYVKDAFKKFHIG